jgi:GR25 family glycosyltransferase involved in LPS biosynthesis
MHVGITYDTRKGGEEEINRTAFTLVSLFHYFKYDIVLINLGEKEKLSWGSYNVHKVCNTSYAHYTDTIRVDLLIDIGGQLHPDVRKANSKKSIVFFYECLQFAEMEKALYFSNDFTSRDLSGVDEIWVWDILNPLESIPSIQGLFKSPIRRVPFVWSPAFIDGFSMKRENAMERTIHICEENVSNMGSFMIPFLSIRELVNQGVTGLSVQCHNMGKIRENKFFMDNIYKNLDGDSLPLVFCDTNSMYTMDGNYRVFFSHTRFADFRPFLLDMLYLGIPVVHNSPILKTLHPFLDDLYYENNSILQAVVCIHTAFGRFRESVYEIGKSIEDQYGVAKNAHRWVHILNDFAPSKEFVVLFSDMWPGFRYDSNFFIDSLQFHYKDMKITGRQYVEGVAGNVLIFGPFGDVWKSITGVPKIFFSAENCDIPRDESIVLYLTHNPNSEDGRFVQLPAWMIFVNWFNYSREFPEQSSENPIRVPYSFAKSAHPIDMYDREEFCAFVVSNPLSHFRNRVFGALNGFQKVNSGGALYNNIGGQLELKYPGGGAGDVSKYHFYTKHRFCLCFENSRERGYITEKLLHAKMAGCIPIYWGDDASYWFDPDSYVDVSHITTPDEIVKMIEGLEKDKDRIQEISRRPLLNEERLERAYSKIHEVCDAIVNARVVDKRDDIGVGKCFVINMKKREDRWDTLCKEEPWIGKNAKRFIGYDGRNVRMNGDLHTLFQHNDFAWKKGVIGCALSHIALWQALLLEPNYIQSYLILEDDVRFVGGWQEGLRNIPDDAELVYLGGVLPCNKSGLSGCLKKVNEQWSTIIPNTLFTRESMPYFHFCTYSYILTRKGAMRLINQLQHSEKKCYTSIDHYLGRAGLKTYVANEMLTRCFQEGDEAYMTSKFDDFSRIDTFDTDIWNNNDCYSRADLENCFKYGTYDINGIINELNRSFCINQWYPSFAYDICDDGFKGVLNRIWCYNYTRGTITTLLHILQNSDIPLYVRFNGDDEIWRILSEKLCLMQIPDTEMLGKVVEFFRRNPERAEVYRYGIQEKIGGLIYKV